MKTSISQDLTRYGVDTAFTVPKGLNTGENAPVIQTITLTGDSVDTGKWKGKHSWVVIFYRGDWCPVCSRFLSGLNDSLPLLYAKNAKIIAIGIETPKNAQHTVKKTKTNIPVIADTSMRYARAFDVLFRVTKSYQRKIHTFLLTDIAKNNGQQEAFLPVPATFIIDKTGKIIYKHFNFNYTHRASMKTILEHLE